MFITSMIDVHITRFNVIKVRASTVVLRCLVVFKNFIVFWNFSRRWISCTDSKGNESRNIYDLNFRITNLYRGHRVIKIKEIFICFRLFLEKYENLMLSYVLKKVSFQLSVSIYRNTRCTHKLAPVGWNPITNVRMYINLLDASCSMVIKVLYK